MTEAKKPRKVKKPNEKVEKKLKNEEVVQETLKETAQELPTKTVAKTGRRSAKTIKETEEKLAKQQRKAEKVDPPKTKTSKPTKNAARSRVERSGKKFKEGAQQLEASKTYTLAEATELATKTSFTKFDATVELHVNLNIDPKQADQNVRDSVVLPAGTGKSLKIAAFVEGDDVEKAKKAGADQAGADELQPQLEKEELSFDILISTPALMPQLSKFARFLGPRGLMPNPKSGTVTNDVAKAVQEAKSGRVEYRVDSAGIIHMGIGKVGFGAEKLLENAQAALTSIKAAKPASLKGTYIKSTYITTTMGPSIRTENP